MYTSACTCISNNQPTHVVWKHMRTGSTVTDNHHNSLPVEGACSYLLSSLRAVPTITEFNTLFFAEHHAIIYVDVTSASI